MLAVSLHFQSGLAKWLSSFPFDNLSTSTLQVRVEAALTLRALAEVDPTCANNLLSCGVTTLRALREIVVVEKVGAVWCLILEHLHSAM